MAHSPRRPDAATVSDVTTPTVPTAADPDGSTALDVAGPTSRRKVLAWGMWDWGSQPFNTVITTFVFSVYVTSESFGATNATSTALAISTAISGVFVALLAPVLGQNGDRSGKHGAEPADPDVAARRALGLACTSSGPSRRTSGSGWCCWPWARSCPRSPASTTTRPSTRSPPARPSGGSPASAGGWATSAASSSCSCCTSSSSSPRSACSGSPTRRRHGHPGVDGGLRALDAAVHDPRVPRAQGPRGRPRATRVGVDTSYRLVGRSIKGLWNTSRHTVYFLLASALYRDGLAGVFAFGAILASGTFGLSAGDVIVFGAAANIVAGIATMGFGLLDDRIGPKKVILVSLGSSVLGALIFILHDGGVATFWVLGLLMTVFVGPAQAASRSFLARLIPEGKNGEIFGLYATTGRVVSFMAPAAFAAFIAIGAALTGEENTQYWGILGHRAHPRGRVRGHAAGQGAHRAPGLLRLTRQVAPGGTGGRSAGELEVPGLGQRAAGRRPRRVEPAEQRSVLLHPPVRRELVLRPPTGPARGPGRAGSCRASPRSGRGCLHRDLLRERAVRVGDAQRHAGLRGIRLAQGVERRCGRGRQALAGAPPTAGRARSTG